MIFMNLLNNLESRPIMVRSQNFSFPLEEVAAHVVAGYPKNSRPGSQLQCTGNPYLECR